MQIPDSYNRVNPDLLNLLPVDAGMILEVGCGLGVLARLYRQIHPNTRYIGIESLPEAARQARDRLDRVLIGPPEALEQYNRTWQEECFDCIIFHQVLAQVADPTQVLQKYLRYLKPSGQVVISVPNIQHWSLLGRLITGQWQYQADSLLDARTLRLYSYETIHQLCLEAGLHVLDIRGRGSESPDWQAMQPLAQPLLEALKVSPEEFARRSRVQEYVLRAVLQVPAKRYFMQSLLIAPIACDRVRILEPNQCLTKLADFRVRDVHRNPEKQDFTLEPPQAGEEPILIFQRPIFNEKDDLQRIRMLLERGFLLVAEMDDDPRHHERFDPFTYRACHAVQTSTEPLAKLLRELNPNVGVFTNQLATLPPLPPRDAKTSPVRLFFGALNREQDWEPWLPTLNRVLSHYGDRIHVEVVHDQKFFDALTTPHKTFSAFCPFEQYAGILSKCDISFLPLRETSFNAMKSDLKFLECAGFGAVALASPTVYRESIQDGVTGFLFDSERVLEDRLRLLIEDEPARLRVREQAHIWVGKERMLSQHFQKRAAWYRQLCGERERLNAELQERVPEVFGLRNPAPSSSPIMVG